MSEALLGAEELKVPNGTDPVLTELQSREGAWHLQGCQQSRVAAVSIFHELPLSGPASFSVT